MARIYTCDKCKKEIKDNLFFEISSSFGSSYARADIKIMLCNKCEKPFLEDFQEILIKHKIIKDKNEILSKREKI